MVLPVIAPRSWALASVAVVLLLLGLTGCERWKLSPNEQEREDAKAAAKKFFDKLRESKPSNAAVWGLRDFSVFGPDWDSPGFSQTALSPPSYRATYSFWCVGTSPGGDTARRRRVLEFYVSRTGKGAFAVSKAQFIADSPLAISDQLASFFGEVRLFLAWTILFAAMALFAVRIGILGSSNAMYWIGLVSLFGPNHPVAGVALGGVILWVSAGESLGFRVALAVVYAVCGAYGGWVFFGSYVGVGLGLLVILVPALLVVVALAAGRRRQSTPMAVDSAEIDRLLREYAEFKKGSSGR